MKVAVYARVSTHDQTAENQLLELRRYVQARGWTATEYVDNGISGSRDRRPALDELTADVRRHKVQAVICWRLDRLGRNLRHLVLLLDEWQSRGIAFVTLGEGIDTSTPGGRLVAAVLGSIAEFERARIQERIHAGLQRARAQGKCLGPRRSAAARLLDECDGLSHAAAAAKLGVSEATVKRWRRARGGQNPCRQPHRFRPMNAAVQRRGRAAQNDFNLIPLAVPSTRISSDRMFRHSSAAG
jgi:DNA invertase Pin-like site-specific DNA recombinase